MAREIIEGRALVEFPVVDAADYLAGTKARVFTQDGADGAFSAYVEAPRDISFNFPEGRTLELFVLSGAVTANGADVGSNILVYMPPKSPRRAITLHAGSAVFFATGEKDTGSGEFAIIDPDTIPWQVRTSECALTVTGTSVNVVKHLRSEPGSRNNFGIDVMWPGSNFECTEWHDVADEIFRLRGDLLLLDPITGQPVEAKPGSYAWRPLNSRHLPKYSHTGSVQIFRNREWPVGNVTMGYTEAPDWTRHLAAYKAKFKTIDPIPGL